MENHLVECPECHTKNPSDSVFCNKCGTQFGIGKQESASFTKTLLTPGEELTVGKTLADRYHIVEELGKGGMGFVYKVFDTKIQEDVALKVLKPEVAAHKDTITRFSNELKFARRITHKNVCRMHDINEAGGMHFITMEYVEGENLKSVVKRMGKLKLGNVLSIALQVTDGLAEAHSLGIVHRDLKPQNIMIDKEGNAKIMDFGIARSVEGKGLTVEGMVIGTPDYMSPEQVEGQKADQRSDIYSLGVILYEMVTGKVPFSGDTAFSVALKHKSEEPRDPKQLNPQLPEGMTRAILRCMEKDRNKRYQSAEELLAVLMAVEETLPQKERVAQKIMPRIAVARAEKSILKKILVPALALVAVVVAGIIAWRLLTPQQPAIMDSGRPTLAILPVKNSTGDSNFDDRREGLLDLIISDMIQSKYIHVLDFSRMYSVLTKTNLWDAKNYTEKDLKNIAEEARATHIIQPTLIKAGENFRILATLKEIRTMDTIASVDADGKGEDSFYAMVDSLTVKFKPHFNLSEEQIANDFDEPIRDVTTNDEKARQLYLDGHKAFSNNDPLQAEKLLEQAVAIDPDFAMAHWLRSRAYIQAHSLGLLPGIGGWGLRFKEANQKAYEAAQKGCVTEREGLFIEAFYGEYWQQGNRKKLEQLVKIYPEDLYANSSLGGNYFMNEEYEKALKHYEVVFRNNAAGSFVYLRISQIYFYWGMIEKSREILKAGMKKFPEAEMLFCFLPELYVAEKRHDEALAAWKNCYLANPIGLGQGEARGHILLFQEDFAAAEKEYRKLWADDRNSFAGQGMSNLIDLYVLQGRFEDAVVLCEQAKKRWSEDNQRINRINRNLAGVLLIQGNVEGARELAASSQVDLDGSIYAKLHLWDKAEQKIEDTRIIGEKQEERFGYYRIAHRRHLLIMRGDLEFERGNVALAIEYFEQAKNLFTGIHHGVFAYTVDALARAYYEAGNLERASEEFELITTLTWGRINDGDIYAKSFYMLGKIYEEVGKKREARRNYERFMELWKNADPGLPEVDDARARLAAL
jgi:serine/threonine protein kinase/tetratricopeptide (TPR) repeat protein